jgi:DNA primase
VGYENTLDAEVRVIIMPQGKDPDDVIKEDAKAWQKLLEKAVPIIDYTFDKVTSELDLNTAQGTASAVERLGHIINEMKDATRQGYYIDRLARLVKQPLHIIEAALKRMRPDRKAKETEREATVRAVQPLLSSPKEEYCLALLLQHPELKKKADQLAPEYFQNSENREIFIAWQRSDKIELIKENLEPAIHEHFDSLITRNLLSNNLEQKYAECALELREKSLRSLAMKIEAVLALEAQSGGTVAELAKLKELGTEVSSQLGEVFAQKSQRRLEQRK